MNQIAARTTSTNVTQVDNYKKGELFEEYIIKLFNEQFFYLNKWRKSTPYADGQISGDLWNPDIEMELVFSGKKRYRFAVECKWRKEFTDGKIFWARDEQIVSYRIFQDQWRIPVFVAIGIGGAPDNPERLFLTPLNNIYMHNELYESDLIPYKRKPTSRFYYDFIQLKLF